MISCYITLYRAGRRSAARYDRAGPARVISAQKLRRRVLYLCNVCGVCNVCEVRSICNVGNVCSVFYVCSLCDVRDVCQCMECR